MLFVFIEISTNKNETHKNKISIETNVLIKFLIPNIIPQYDKKTPINVQKNTVLLIKLCKNNSIKKKFQIHSAKLSKKFNQ